MKQTIVIATRKSPLAMQQAQLVQAQLQQHHPALTIKLLGITSQGDQILDQSLAKIGGKGLFTKALEDALLSGRADIAVHSMKDVPMQLPEGLCIPCILAREDCRDVWVARNELTIPVSTDGLVVGTSSVRRAAQLLAMNPTLDVRWIRGNVQTRLRKLDKGGFDAIILAAAGLKRLGLSQRIQHYFSAQQLLPSPGQGAIGIECRAEDASIQALLSPLHDAQAAVCVNAERKISQTLQASCQLPLAALATIVSQTFHITSLVGRPDGSELIKREATGLVQDAEELAVDVANQLIAAGGKSILQAAQ